MNIHILLVILTFINFKKLECTYLKDLSDEEIQRNINFYKNRIQENQDNKDIQINFEKEIHISQEELNNRKKKSIPNETSSNRLPENKIVVPNLLSNNQPITPNNNTQINNHPIKETQKSSGLMNFLDSLKKFFKDNPYAKWSSILAGGSALAYAGYKLLYKKNQSKSQPYTVLSHTTMTNLKKLNKLERVNMI